MRKCPSCGNQLLRKPLGQAKTLVSGCQGCGGTWLARDVFKRLAASEAQALIRLERAFRPGVQVSLDAEANHACPECQQSLTAFDYPGVDTVKVMGCPDGHGLHFRDCDLETIAVALGADPNLSVEETPEVSDPTDTSRVPLKRGTPVMQIDAPTDFVARIETGFHFVSGAIKLIWREKRILKPIIYSWIATIVALFFVYFGVHLATGGHYDIWFKEHVGAANFGILVLGVLISFIHYFAMAMTINMVDAYLKDLEPNIVVAFADAKKNFKAIVLMALVGSLIQFLANASRRRGILGSAVSSVVTSMWTVVGFLLLPIIIVEDAPFGSALRRARDIHRGNILQIGITELGVNLISNVIFMAVGFIVGFLVYFGTLGGTIGMILAVLLAVALVAVTIAFNIATKAAYYTCLYHWAAEREGKKAGEEALVPDMLLPAFGLMKA